MLYLGLPCLLLAGCGGDFYSRSSQLRKAPGLVWAAPAAIYYGTALSAVQLNAAANIPGTFAYSPTLGTVLTAGVEEVSVTFTPTDTADYAMVTDSVLLTVNPSAPLVTWPNPAAISYSTTLSAAQLNAVANVPGTFVYAPALGALLHAGAQTLSVAFTPTDAVDYTMASANVALAVNPIAPVLNWAPSAAISYSTPLSAAELDATANVAGMFVYIPASGAVLHAGAQTLSAAFTPTDAVDYTTASANGALVVNPIAPVLSWAPSAAISYGTPLSAVQLNAAANIPGTFAYSPPAGALLPAGSQTLSVTFAPVDAVDYSAVNDSVALSITQATPLMTWAPRDPIAVAVALGASQLDAAALAPGNSMPVAGTYAYTPAAGTTFTSTGPQALSVTFFPADAVDYTTAEAAITMTVGSFGVAAWGDSLTAGREGSIDAGVYPTDLQQAIVLPVENLGIDGQTSTEIGVREGGVPVNVVVTGGSIPAAGSVIVTFPSGSAPVTGGGPFAGITGSILGVHGRVKLSSGVTTFTPTTSGSVVSAPGTPPFVVDTPYAGYLPVFWEGRNNISDPKQILSDLAGQVATVASGQTFLVMSITNFNNKDEWIGGTVYNEIVTLNNQLANIYGSHYLDIRKLLVSHYDPTLITDVSDWQHDNLPTSLRAILRTGTLDASVGPADTSFAVTENTGSPVVGDILTIDSGENAENVKIQTANGNTVTVMRNFGGLDTAHAAGVPVVETDYMHLNAQGDQIIAEAVAQFLSAYESPAQ